MFFRRWKKECEELRRELESGKIDNRNLKYEFENLRSRHDDLRVEFRKEEEVLNDRIESLADRLSECQAERQSAVADLNQALNRIDGLEGALWK